MSRVRTVSRAATALVVLVGLVVGVPAALVLIAGWPLPRSLPQWGRVVTALRQGDIAGEVVVKAIACIVWVAWVQLAWALIWEIAVNVRHADHGRPAQAVPLVPSAVGIGVARLVSIVLSVGLVIATTQKPVLAKPRAVATLVAPLPTILVVAPAPVVHGPTWQAKQGESLWSIAKATLGAGERFTELLDLNPSIGSPRNLRAGHVLALPPDAVVPVDGYVAREVVVVAAGDTLWGLSEQRLVEAHQEPPVPVEVLEYVHKVVNANPDVIEDPSLIYPGEEIELPAIGTPPLPAPSSPAVESALPTPPVAPTAPPATPSPVVSVPVATATEPAVSADRPAGQGRPWYVDLTGATVLASGLWLTYRQAKQRQAVSGRRVAHTPDRLREAERQLLRAADVPLVRWANHELAGLCERLKPRDVEGGPVAVEFSAEHGIELLWDRPNLTAPSPWEATDGGWSWRILYDPDEPLPSTPEPAPIPGLVTVGTRDGNSLLLDLEAFGTIAITGNPGEGLALVRSIVLELTTSDEFANSYIHLDTSVEIDLPPSDRLRHREAEDLRKLLSAPDLKASGTFRARLGGNAGGRELTVVVADAKSLDAAEPCALPGARSGVVALVFGASPGIEATLDISDDEAQLTPLGLRFQPAGVRQTTVTLLDELTAAIAHEPAEPPGSTEPLPLTQADDRLIVRLLGAPVVDGFEDALRPLDVSVVAFLACNGGKATVDQLVDAVWNGNALDQRTVWNRLGRIRSILGPTVLPPRDQGSVIRLGRCVTTDINLLAELLSDLTASPDNAPALASEAADLIRGTPFDSTGYEWAHAMQFHDEACTLIESVVLAVVETADEQLARCALLAGLRALPLNEEAVRAKMRMEATTGDLTRVRTTYKELAERLRDRVGDSAVPAAETQNLLRTLTSNTDAGSVGGRS